MAQRLVVVDHPVLADRLDRHARPTRPARRVPPGALRGLGDPRGRGGARPAGDRRSRSQTPLEPAAGSRLPGEITIVPVLRAGLGMVDGFLRLLPGRARGPRRASTATRRSTRPVDYYERLPPGLADSHVFVVDPMLATGGSAVHALDRLQAAGARQLRWSASSSRRRGSPPSSEHHPDVPIWTAAVDRELDENAYIRPGLGDAGDRVFGT